MAAGGGGNLDAAILMMCDSFIERVQVCCEQWLVSLDGRERREEVFLRRFGEIFREAMDVDWEEARPWERRWRRTTALIRHYEEEDEGGVAG